jgi:putative hydrolase of the HAD superfamily
MAKVTTLLWDVGGVLLTNGWPRESRRLAARHFNLDWEELESRHEPIMADFETGKIGLEKYLDQAIFFRARPFSREDFKNFMLAQSKPYSETLALVMRLAESKKYLICALNNESLELNLYRIERFDLRRYFTAFFSSCFLGVRKPDEAIYRAALNISQKAPEECLFIDDRAPNVESAARIGIGAIHYQNPAQLRPELCRHGVELQSE